MTESVAVGDADADGCSAAHTDDYGWLGKLDVGDAVELKVLQVGHVTAVISRIDVAIPGAEKGGVKMTVCWDPPDGFCSVDIDNPKQRAWLRPHPAASAAAWAALSSSSAAGGGAGEPAAASAAAVKKLKDEVEDLKHDTAEIEDDSDVSAGASDLKPGQFIVVRSDMDGARSGGRYVVDVKASDTVADVKRKLHEVSLSPEQYRLMNAGRVLGDERLFSEYNINPRSSIRLVTNAEAEEKLVVRLRDAEGEEVRAFFSKILACVF